MKATAEAIRKTVLVCAAMRLFGVNAATEIVDGIEWEYRIENGQAEVWSESSTAVPPSTGGSIAVPSMLGGVPVTSIGAYAFHSCGLLERVTMPDSVKSIGESAFYGCTSLKSVMIPSGVTNIGEGAFCRCESLSGVTLPKGISKISDYMFSYCASLNDVAIPDNVMEIGSGAFNGCSSIKELTIPCNVSRIGSTAFCGCSSLESVSIPSSVESVGYRGFYGCPVRNATVPGWPCEIDFSLVTNLVISQGSQHIDWEEFSECASIERLTIPDSVKHIGGKAFYGCSSLVEVIWAGGVESVDFEVGAFTGTPYADNSPFRLLINRDGTLAGFWGASPKNVVIPDGVTAIEEGAFNREYCNVGELESVTIPDSVTRISYGAFSGCNDTVYDTTSVPGVILVDGWAVGYTESIPAELDLSGVRGIGERAFEACGSIVSVAVSDGVKAIGYGAFYDCESLADVAISDSVKSIAYEAFSGCADAVYDTTSIPGVILVDGWAVGYTESIPANLDLAGIRGIGEWAFESCESIVGVIVPDGVDAIGRYAFCECESLVDVQISDGVAIIEEGAFQDCRLLADVKIPSSVKYVGRYAFGYCDQLSNVTVSSDDLVLDATAFATELPVAYDEYGDAVDWFDTCPTNLKAIAFEKAGYNLSGWKTELIRGGDKALERLFAADDLTPFASNVYYGVCKVSPVKKANLYSVTFDANGGEGTMPYLHMECDEDADLGVCRYRRVAYDFVGWSTSPESKEAEYADGSQVKNLSLADGGEVVLYAVWKRASLWNRADGGSSGESVSGGVSSTDGTAVPEDAASVYDAYLYCEDVIYGTVQAKVSRPKNGAAKVTVTIQAVGKKKLSLKGSLQIDSGRFSAVAKDGRELTLDFGMCGMSGRFDGYDIDGARNFFSSKDKSESAAAKDVLAPWLGTLNIFVNGAAQSRRESTSFNGGCGSLNVKIAKRGKVTIKGTLGGENVSMKAQAIIGDKHICIPVAYSKKSINLAFALWLPIGGGDAGVFGMNDAVIGRSGTLKSDVKFHVDREILSDVQGVVSYNGKEVLPEGESVSVSGSKWIVAGGAKAAKVVIRKGELSITPGKKGGEIANISGLKLKHKAKDGTFSGSFTVYAEVNGRLKKHRATVFGVVIDGVGYGTATVKKIGSWSIKII